VEARETATLAIAIRNLKIETDIRKAAVRELKAGTEAIKGYAS
jgi:hypothetical protein